MRIERHYTTDDGSPREEVAYRTTACEIRNPDGSAVFAQKDVEVPASWSQVACDVLAQKYFRKAGIAARRKPVPEADVPEWLWRSAPDPEAEESADPADDKPSQGERSAKEVFHRLAGTWTYWGWKAGYFDSESDARAFYDELFAMLALQVAAPNSPQWFNTGLHWAYGIDGPAQGHYYVDFESGALKEAESAYEHPQPHACFIQSIRDDLVNEGGIMDLWVREARLFKYGSGTGTNFSNLRGEGEPLSGGGKSSGLMSFLKIGDRAAGAIKSGGTTRRAAKMVIVDVDHPDIEDFVSWKVVEEQKVAALVSGSQLLHKHLNAVVEACHAGSGSGRFEPKSNPALSVAVREARKALVPETCVYRAIRWAEQGFTEIDFRIYDSDWQSEAYLTVSGQNSNNSIRVTDAFLQQVETGGPWDLIRRTDGKVAKTIEARALWDQIVEAAWASADPGIQFDSTINAWHTCPAGGRINASNPCSEYMFLDDTACNLASLNLITFRRKDGSFDIESFEHAVRLWTVVLEIAVVMAQFPSREIAQRSYLYRTLGLGFANLGGLLMSLGLSYDSTEGRALCGAISALMTGTAYAASAEMAGEHGAFPAFDDNRDAMLRVIRNHRAAARGESERFEGLDIRPVPLDHANLPDRALGKAAKSAWDRAVKLGEKHGYRNAQATVIAPTGTIGLVMDCDTTGIEPDFALVKFKKLAGGGHFKIINGTVPKALKTLGYTAPQIREIVAYAVGNGTLKGAPAIDHTALARKGFTSAVIARVEGALDAAFDLNLAFNKWTLGVDFCTGTLGLDAGDLDRPGFDLLGAHGFQRARDRGGHPLLLRGDDAGRRAARQGRASARLRLRQSLRADRLQPLPLDREPCAHDGGGPTLHLRRHLEDHQLADGRHRRGLPPGLRAFLAPRPQGQRALPRRLQALPAALRARAWRRPRGGDGGRDCRRTARRDEPTRPARRRRANRQASDSRGRAAAPAPSAARLHAEGHRRRPQGLSQDRRVPGRLARRDLHRHAQGRCVLPQPDEQFRDLDLDRAAIRRAAGRVRRCLHLHAVRAGGDSGQQRRHQDEHLDPRLHLPRARHLLSGAQRPLPCRGRRPVARHHRRRRGADGARSDAGPARRHQCRPRRPGECRLCPLQSAGAQRRRRRRGQR